MLEILNYLRVRYMDEKAQGIVEYALLYFNFHVINPLLYAFI